MWSIKQSIQEGRVGNIALYVEEHFGHNWNSHMNIYTDGSGDPESRRVGFGIYVPHVHLSQSRRSPDGSSVFTAELAVTLWAPWWVEEGGLEKVIICSDSLSALTASGG